MTRKVLIVDGYNVIRLTPPYRDLADDDLESARAALVSDVAAYAAGEWDAFVIFDGGGNPHSTGEPHEVAGVRVMFSRAGQDADTAIEALSRRHRESGDAVEVVTSDAQTQWAVFGRGVVRRSSAEFASDLRDEDARWREHTPLGRTKITLADRIDASMKDRLSRWARGLE